FEPQHRQSRFPLRFAFLAVRYRDARVPVVIALNEPFEAEIDQRWRINQEFNSGHGVRILTGRRAAAVTLPTTTLSRDRLPLSSIAAGALGIRRHNLKHEQQ